MPARSISTASLTFGLVSIPVRLFPATSSKSVSFHLLHEKDMSRIQQKIYCPKEDKIVDRSELVRGYEIEKDRYVTFTDDELKKLEAQADRAVEITEFIPASEVDPVYFENSYLLGCEPTSAKAYRLLQEAMTKAERVGVAKYTMRGKERVVLIRPYENGLMLHTMYYADEIRSFGEIDHGENAQVKESELTLAQRLLDDLTQKKFNPSEFKDNYRERVIEAAEQKMAGHELTEAPPEQKQGKVIDLMSALKESLKKRGVGVEGERGEETGEPAEREERKSAAHGSHRAPRTRRARS
jgi:DNA end-binding protein Ku